MDEQVLKRRARSHDQVGRRVLPTETRRRASGRHEQLPHGQEHADHAKGEEPWVE